MRPIARPIASSGGGESARVRTTSGQVASGTDAPSSGSSRISAVHLEQIAGVLSANDQAVIDFLADVRLATGHQVARRLWAATAPADPNARAARRALARLERWRVIQRQGRRLGGVRGGSTSIVYGLGPTGQRLLTARGFEARRGRELGERYIAHTVAASEIVVRLAEADRRGDLELVGLETEPRCWRGFVGPYGAREVLKPDLRVTVGAGHVHLDSWWLEVDLATESAAAIVRKAKRYVAYMHAGIEQRDGAFPRIVFAVPDQRRERQIQGALGRLSGAPKRLFEVWPFEETVGRLASEAKV